MFKLAHAVPLAAALLAATPAVAQTYQIRFQNNSGAVVYRVYSSPTDNESYRQDLLGANVLQPGQHLDVAFQNVYNCYYDVLIEFSDGSQVTDTFDICSYDRYNIN